MGVPVPLEARGGFRLSLLNRENELFQGRRVVIFVGAAWVLSYLPWSAVAE